jgi:lipopolysaccharide biosynthesis glycosyltransferase
VKIYIGQDSREPEAYRAACASLEKHAQNANVTPLDIDRLASFGLLRRPVDRRGQLYDLHSNAPATTDFAVSRFLVPHLAQSGWALFVDADVVFLSDIRELFALADPSKAVMVVQHQRGGSETAKMDGQIQTQYSRKNWSSVCLWNCDHPANQRLSLQDVNERPGRDLHRFYWLADSEIGALPPEWNWLVNVQPIPAHPKIAHFTLGGPFTPGWIGAPHDEIWLEAMQ